MSDEVWAGSIPPKCPACKLGFPRLLKFRISSEASFDLYMECNACLMEFHWNFTHDDFVDEWVEQLTELQDERYGDSVGDFAAWEDSLLEEVDPEAGIQMELPDMDWWYV